LLDRGSRSRDGYGGRTSLAATPGTGSGRGLPLRDYLMPGIVADEVMVVN
jgi:hypothetical protein